MRRLLTLAASLFLVVQGVERPGSALVAGMQLVYASGGTSQPPWTIDSVLFDSQYEGRSGCTYMKLRTTGNIGEPELRVFCSSGDTLYGWDQRSKRYRPARPLGARMSIEMPRFPNGSARFETEAPTRETVAGRELVVLPTIVTTRDAAGQTVRRLRERYAPALATAVGGVFEIPDPTQPSGWRTQQEFSLVEIRTP